MGGSVGCCGCCQVSVGSGNEEEARAKFAKGTPNSLSEGPKLSQDRGCTDLFCLPVFAIFQLIFVIVTIAGVSSGNPAKLYRPRDFQGAYCGFEENWNNGPKTLKQEWLSYTMNVSSTTDGIVKELICSPSARKALVDGDPGNSIDPILATEDERKEYLCNCCLTPCSRCSGSFDVGEASTVTDLSSTVKGKMGELTGASQTSAFDPAGLNEGAFSAQEFWSQATKHFHQVCLPDCTTSHTTSDKLTRTYVYEPSPADLLHDAWVQLYTAKSTSLVKPIQETINSSFTFAAYDISVCPYSEEHCVPFPGVEFGELGANRCTMQMAAAVVAAVGAEVSKAFGSVGMNAFASDSIENFGEWFGDFQATIDSFCIVCVLAFVVGLLFIVVLRFTVGFCVWMAVLMTILFFYLLGAACFVVSGQCQGAGIFESGKETVVATAVLAQSTLSDKLNGADGVSEYMDPAGDGSDYRGKQRYTKSGKKCLAWDTQTAFPEYTSARYPDANLTQTFCRNPVKEGEGELDKAKTIWCVTSDAATPWEECRPIGVIRPECENGYAVTSKNMRNILFYSSFFIIILGVIWTTVICCFFSRIRLAVALNKVAADFVKAHPQVVLIPIVQAFIACFWTVAWFFAASFLLSQVPDGYVPTGYYTYSEAVGTGSTCAFWEGGDECQGTPGECTKAWPNGKAWRDSTCGLGGANGTEVACWRCSPPRYNFDTRFAISFFVFLWNNAFNVAMGQILIAMCVSLWFFKQDRPDGVASPRRALLRKAIWTICRYHLGSVAFGSFIVALVQFIRFWMKYMEKQAQAQKNRVMVMILRCLQCCIWCFEKCIKFLNKNAYIQIALLGNNFCSSAKKAFFLILRNALRFGLVAILGHVVHVIGIVAIVMTTMALGYLIVRAMHPETSPFMPCFAFFCVSVTIAKVYMNVFGLAVDTSLQCFLAIEEEGEGQRYVPVALKRFVADKRASLEARETVVPPEPDQPATAKISDKE